MTEQDLKQLWKNQPSTNPPLSEATLRKKARQLQRRVAVRNLLEYAAGAVVIPIFAWYISSEASAAAQATGCPE